MGTDVQAKILLVRYGMAEIPQGLLKIASMPIKTAERGASES